MKTQEEMMEQNRLVRREFLSRGFDSEIIFDTKELDDVAYNQEWWGKMNVVRQLVL